MIKRSLLVAALLTLTYIVVQELNHTAWKEGQSKQRLHLVKSQQYLYESRHDTVLVGSSLAASSVTMGNLPESWVNLAFEGGSPYTGAQLACTNGRTAAEVVLFETNIAYKEADMGLVEEATHVVYANLARLYAFREGNRPSVVFNILLSKLLPSGLQRSKIDSRRIIQFNKGQDKELDENFDNAEVDSLLNEIAKYKCSNIRFVEYPTGRESREKQMAFIRKKIKEKYPDIPYFRYSPDAVAYTDEVHMGRASDEQFTDSLKTWLRKQ